MKRLLTHLLTAGLAAGLVWMLLREPVPATGPAGAAGKTLLYYQSPMHPWVKSSQPGRCTVCGMQLVPVYQGDKGYDKEAAGSGIVMLPAGSPNVMGLQTSEVKRRPLERTMRVAGLVEDDDSRHRIMSAYTGGRVEKLFVNFEGAEVKAGQPLATFYSQDLLSAARDYKLAIKQGGGSLQVSAGTRLRQLGLTPEQITAVPDRADDDLFFEILAPVSGTVVKRHVYEGQYVQEGGELFEIADFSRMWFQFIAYEQDLPFLRTGQKVRLTTPSIPGKVIESSVTFINPNLDEMTRSARVRVEIENKETPEGLGLGREFLHKLYGEAVVALDAPEVITVPRQAVLWSNLQPRVYVEKEVGTYQQRAVTLGRTGDAYFEVVDGLKDGERVVLTGNMLIDGQAQLDAMATGGPPALESAPALTAMPDMDHTAWLAYLKAVDAVNAALADDNLEAAHAALQKLPASPEGIIKIPPPPPVLDLKELRKAFLPWSQEVAKVATAMQDHLPGIHIFRCPMTNDLWTGAPANAKWIQLTTDLRNPYWGHEMRSCGTEIKP